MCESHITQFKASSQDLQEQLGVTVSVRRAHGDDKPMDVETRYTLAKLQQPLKASLRDLRHPMTVCVCRQLQVLRATIATESVIVGRATRGIGDYRVTVI